MGSRIRYWNAAVYAAPLLLMLCAAKDRCTLACPGCVLAEDAFSVSHPHAIRLAVATRQAIDGRLIGEYKERRPEDLEADLARAASLISYPLTGGRNAVLDIMLVDLNAVYRVEMGRLGSRVTRIAPGSDEATIPRIVTTRAVLHAVSEFELRFADAVFRGLAEMEGDLSTAPQLPWPNRARSS